MSQEDFGNCYTTCSHCHRYGMVVWAKPINLGSRGMKHSNESARFCSYCGFIEFKYLQITELKMFHDDCELEDNENDIQKSNGVCGLSNGCRNKITIVESTTGKSAPGFDDWI